MENKEHLKKQAYRLKTGTLLGLCSALLALLVFGFNQLLKLYLVVNDKNPEVLKSNTFKLSHDASSADISEAYLAPVIVLTISIVYFSIFAWDKFKRRNNEKR